MKGESVCKDNTDMPEAVTVVSDAVVSPAISLAAPLSNGREQLKTESTDTKHQSSNQSGSKPVEKPNCYKCKHRSELVYSAHSECKHPLALYELAANLNGASVLGVRGNAHGIKKGWFMFPFNFDPVWLDSCNAFEP